MKMVLIDEKRLEARVVDCDPQKRSEMLQELMEPMRCCAVMTREIAGREYSIAYDDEFLFHRYNVTGFCENSEEILMGSLLIAGFKEEDEWTDDDDPDWGLRGLTDEECDAIVKAWHPVSPELAQRYARDVHPSLLYMMGSNALHYDA